MSRFRNQKPADVKILGVSEVKTVNADHYVRSECGNWVTLWEDFTAGEVNGPSDMKVPRERVVVIEPREKAETDSVAKAVKRKETRA